MDIRPFHHRDTEDVIALSLLAWAPVFDSFEKVLGPTIFQRIYPDWKSGQRSAVDELCNSEKTDTWVAEVEGMIVGFVLWELNREDLSAEVHMLAVHPSHQNHGIGTELNDFALTKLKEAGMTLAVVSTGGDVGHAPARRSYEKAGYTALPLVRYYKAL